LSPVPFPAPAAAIWLGSVITTLIAAALPATCAGWLKI
jgi:hypothetical protein